MKVAIISRATLYSVPGGDTRQMVETAKYLRKEGITVDIFATNGEIDYASYDLLHFFNITRPADIIKHVKQSHKPFVISPIFVAYDKINEQGKGGLLKIASKLLTADGLQYLKSIGRWLLNGEKIVSWQYLFLGQRGSITWLAKRAAYMLPNSENEMRRFIAKYRITGKYRVVPNGVEQEVIEKYASMPAPEEHNRVICVARFEPLKNQLALITALNNSQYQVYLYGKPAPNHKVYYEECIAAAAPNIHFGGWLEGEAVYKAYKEAKVHILPSYFETTGLSSLEAAAIGCNVVITDKGDTRDYFGNDAWYCNPDDIASIKAAVDAACATPYDPGFRERILKDYTWTRAAEETLWAYKEVLVQKANK